MQSASHTLLLCSNDHCEIPQKLGYVLKLGHGPKGHSATYYLAPPFLAFPV